MSTRQMARMYSGGGGVSSAGQAGFAGLDLFGINRRRREEEVLRQKEIAKYLQDLEDASKEKEDARKTQSEKEVTSHKAIVDILKSEGIEPTEENIKAYNIGTSANRLKGAGNRSSIDLNDTEAKLGFQTGVDNPDLSTTFKDATKRNLLATMLAPEVKNTKELTMDAGPGSLITVPRGNGFTPLDIGTQIHGSTENQKITEEGGFTDPTTGVTYGAKPVITRSTTPGFVSTKLDPAIKARVESNVSPQPDSSLQTTFPSSFDPQDLQAFQSLINPPTTNVAIPQATDLSTKPIDRQIGNRNLGDINIPEIKPRQPFGSLMPIQQPYDPSRPDNNQIDPTQVLQLLRSLGY